MYEYPSEMTSKGRTRQACHNFFVKKPKIFKNVKSERAAANFQKSRTLRASTIISKNSQIFSDLWHKNMFAGSIITMNMIQHYFCLILRFRCILGQFLANFDMFFTPYHSKIETYFRLAPSLLIRYK